VKKGLINDIINIEVHFVGYLYNMCHIICMCYGIIVHIVLYEFETWSHTLREERRLRVIFNRVFRRIFVAKRDGVTGEWRKLRNEEPNELYCSPDIIRFIKSRMRWLIVKWDVGGMDWIDLAQDRDRWWALVNVVMNLHFP
jgi:hypothetical protein